MKIFRLAILIFVSVFLTACAIPYAPARISSNKAPTYSKEAKRLFVMTDIGSEVRQLYADAFKKKIQVFAKQCGMELETSTLNALELDSSVHTTRMKTFNADTVLQIRRNGGTTYQGVLIWAIYDVKLIDLATGSTVWRAKFNFQLGGDFSSEAARGEALATDLSNKMKVDGVFGSCKVADVQETPKSTLGTFQR